MIEIYARILIGGLVGFIFGICCDYIFEGEWSKDVVFFSLAVMLLTLLVICFSLAITGHL